MIRPRPARWFEVLCARDDVTIVLETLARTGAVELESRSGYPVPVVSEELRQLVGEAMELAQRYRPYWPSEDLAPSPFPEPPVVTLERVLATVRAWAKEAEPSILRLQALESEREDLAYWQQVLRAQPDFAFGRAASAGPLLNARMIVLPLGSDLTLPDRALARGFEMDGRLHRLVVAPETEMRQIAEQAAAAKGKVHRLPGQLVESPKGAAAAIASRLAEVNAEIAEDSKQLDVLSDRHELRRALGDAGRLRWMVQNVGSLDSGPVLAWVSGWTSDADGRRLVEALDRTPARALIRFPDPPEGRRPPLLLRNPRFVRPFEVFTQALGTPGSDEADPSAVLAVIVPLLFGYMFGDVGQGLVLVAAGWVVGRRVPALRLLVPCGIAASVFGLLFGSVFSVHGAIPALWRDPLSAPVTILAIPLGFGAGVILLGLLLQGLESAWGGRLREWIGADLGVVLVYIGAIAAVVAPVALWWVALGAVWFVVGTGVRQRRLSAAAAALGELLERAFQMLINTLSFARVGAFALAHAGLSSAISALAESVDSGLAKALVVVTGNVVVIVLEALVVSIQTTRLVLFEFFTRFLKAQGRPFRPLSLPPATPREI